MSIIRAESVPVVLSSDGAWRTSEYSGFSVVMTPQGRDGQESERFGTEAMTSPIRSRRFHSLCEATFLVLLCGCLPASGQSPTLNPPPIVIDASTAAANPAPARYDEGSALSPSRDAIGLNSRFLTLNGKPWLPVMGEFHFSRYPASRWEEEILKMKAAGVNIVATYVIWIHHEEIEGQVDWTGQRDLRTFAKLCARHGMYLVVRIGPWAHGEVRNGGFPDWLLNKAATRRNDPVYLKYVRAWYGQIGKQLDGELWKDGGPVIGIQLENEYALRGPGAGEAHILELKRIARDSGLDVPFYFVTAWDNAVVPERAVLPVQGGYPDAPWDVSLGAWPPAEVYAFRLHSRIAANIAPAADDPSSELVPFLSAELGGGNEDTYHRRPVIQPDDVAAIVPVMLGSGVNLLGTYMFQGGENPDGQRTTLQESQATGYPNDVPVKSYDFQAPLGEFGQERASFRKLKVFNYFLNDFGSTLAPMTVHAPDKQPTGPGDLSTLRATVRSGGDTGFIFVNNYTRGAAMPARPATQFEIRLPGSTIRVPQNPVNIPSGDYFIWPFNLQVNEITLRYSTAQLFTRLQNAGTVTLYFEAVPGIPVEYAIDGGHARLERTVSGVVANEGSTIYVRGVQPGIDSAVDLISDQGERVRIVTLSREDAEDAWKVRLDSVDRLLISAQDFYSDSGAKASRIWLRTRDARQFAFTLTPAPVSVPHASLPLQRVSATANAVAFTAQAPAQTWELKTSLLQPPGVAPPVKIGPPRVGTTHGVAQAPSDDDFHRAAKWSVNIPTGTMNGLSELFLTVRYTGDVARLYSTAGLLTDNFYNGQPWTVGLSRFLDLSHPNRLELDILPLRRDAPVYIEASAERGLLTGGQIDTLEDMDLRPEYQLVIDTH
jgi:beta-galactosidase